jgi:hypothetical protein
LILNKSLSGKNDLSEDSYIAMAGYAQDNIVQKINNALREKFSKVSSPIDVQFTDPLDILAYSFLYKELKFKTEFEALEHPLEFKSEEVKSFGIKEFSGKIKHTQLSTQVDVIDYRDYSDFIIRLKPEYKNDEIILAKIQPEETLLQTVEKVMSRIRSSEPGTLINNDVLVIPKLSFNVTHNYEELISKDILNKGFTKHFIREARQDILFSLDEKGAVLKSHTIVLFPVKSVVMNRYMIFNEPFLLYLKEKDAKYPYFVLWIENPQLMIKY